MSYFDLEIEAVFSKIESHDSIVIFGHKNPDGDCVGSVLGLKYALKSIFPSKKIYATGSRPSSLTFIEPSDEVSLDTIKSSLCVMVDLSDLKRVEDQRILSSTDIVCIDHHEQSEPFSYPIIRDTKAPSATYVIAKCLKERYHHIPKEAANHLFLGLITDSGRFQYDSNDETLKLASELVSLGADYKYIYNNLYVQNSKNLRFKSFVYSAFKFYGKVSYFIVKREEYLKLGMTEQEAGCQVNLISLLDNHPIWASFCELENGKIRVELRSDGNYNVQQVAVKFNGGGHYAASGCQLDDFSRVEEVLIALNEASK